MPLSKDLIGRLQTILKKNYGVTVTAAEAEEIGMNFVHYFDLLAQIAYRSDEPPQKPP